MKGTKVEAHEYRRMALDEVKDWMANDPESVRSFLHAPLSSWIRQQIPELQHVNPNTACRLGNAIFTGGFHVVREFIKQYPDEIRALLTPVETAEVRLEEHPTPVREADPELERLLAEEEEIERQTRVPRDSSVWAQPSVVTFTAEAMYRAGSYYEGLRDGINELRRELERRGETWTIDHVSPTNVYDGPRPSIVRITGYHRAAHRLVQNGSWSEDITIHHGTDEAISTVELRARLG